MIKKLFLLTSVLAISCTKSTKTADDYKISPVGDQPVVESVTTTETNEVVTDPADQAGTVAVPENTPTADSTTRRTPAAATTTVRGDAVRDTEGEPVRDEVGTRVREEDTTTTKKATSPVR